MKTNIKLLALGSLAALVACGSQLVEFPKECDCPTLNSVEAPPGDPPASSSSSSGDTTPVPTNTENPPPPPPPEDSGSPPEQDAGTPEQDSGDPPPPPEDAGQPPTEDAGSPPPPPPPPPVDEDSGSPPPPPPVNQDSGSPPPPPPSEDAGQPPPPPVDECAGDTQRTCEQALHCCKNACKPLVGNSVQHVACEQACNDTHKQCVKDRNPPPPPPVDEDNDCTKKNGKAPKSCGAQHGCCVSSCAHSCNEAEGKHHKNTCKVRQQCFKTCKDVCDADLKACK